MPTTGLLVQQRAAQVYNVRDFGAVGDGATDDRPAIQAALDYARTTGGGTVYLPPAVAYRVTSTTHPTAGGIRTCLVVGANTRLQGAGAGNSIVKLASSESNQVYIITNYNFASPGGDQNIGFADFTVDGNADGQAGTVDAQYGIWIQYARRVRHRNVTAKNCYGTTAGGNGPNGQNGESVCFMVWGGADASYVDCDAYSDAITTNTSDGFACNYNTNTSWANCRSYGSGKAHGWALFHTYNSSLVGCQSYLQHKAGYHIDVSVNVTCTGCTAGGKSADLASGLPNYPFTTAQASLGNGDAGFEVGAGSTEVRLIGCESVNNANNGVFFNGVGTGAGCAVWGGNYANNTGYGIAIDANATGKVLVAGAPLATGNSTNEIFTGSSPSGAKVLGNQTAPSVPTSTTALTNPFPCEATVYITGGTVSAITVDGIATGLVATPATVRLRAGGTLAITYSVAPTWKWFTE